MSEVKIEDTFTFQKVEVDGKEVIVKVPHGKRLKKDKLKIKKEDLKDLGLFEMKRSKKIH